MKVATLVIITRGNQILFGRKQGSPEIGEGTLNGPGGKMEVIDKTIRDCAIRETQEELGIILSPTELEKLAIITFCVGEYPGVPDFEVHVYRTEHFIGEPHETESMVPEWHNIDNIPYERMLESDSHWLPRLLQEGEKFCAKVYYRERAKDFLGIEFLDECYDIIRQ